MKKLFFILVISCLPFLMYASNNELLKDGRTLAKENVSKAGKTLVKKNVLSVDKKFAKENHSKGSKKMLKASSFYNYCLNYEWQDCNPQILYPVTVCSSISWEDAYNRQLNLYSDNVAYLATCVDGGW